MDEAEVIAVLDAVEAELFPGDDGQLVHQCALGHIGRGKVVQKLLFQLLKMGRVLARQHHLGGIGAGAHCIAGYGLAASGGFGAAGSLGFG